MGTEMRWPINLYHPPTPSAAMTQPSIEDEEIGRNILNNASERKDNYQYKRANWITMKIEERVKLIVIWRKLS